MAFILENEYCRLECVEEGGEIQHFFDKIHQVECMYQGDEGWSGKNPTLFPIVGNTYTGNYIIDGKIYTMKNHGLIRYSKLKAIPKDDCLVFQLNSDPETRKQYPFDFHYEIQYTLNHKTLNIKYRIQNTSECDMPFSFGLHPAFRVPQRPGESFEDYILRFEKREKVKQLVFDETFHDPSKRIDVEFEQWKLSRSDLAVYKTLVFQGVSSESVSLYYKKEPRLSMHFKGYPFLAIWSHPSESDFLCIEPWYGHADYDVDCPDFYHREGTLVLKPDETFEPSYAIEIK